MTLLDGWRTAVGAVASAPVPAAGIRADDPGVTVLIAMTDDAVRTQVRSVFIAQLQQSPAVSGTFFGGSPAPPVGVPAPLTGWVGNVASALIALSLADCSGHGFGSTTDQGVAQTFLDARLAPTDGSFTSLAQANYQQLFPAYCQAPDGTTFQSYLNGSRGPATAWGTALAAALSAPAYMNQQIDKLDPAVDPGGWYQTLFADVFKVQLLNAAEVPSLLNTWDAALHVQNVQAQIPWTVYADIVAGTFDSGTFMGQVQNAISVSYSHTQVNGCQGGPAAHCSSTTTTTYGAAVNDWLSSNAGLGGFVKGPSTDNEDSHLDGGGCCFVPGTPILLADGTSAAVEDVAPGQAVVTRDGAVLGRSPQDVRWPIGPHELLYGINDLRPFFNASHPFMTVQGWKAMSPVAARQINPDLEIGQLEEGDVLLRAEPGTAPLRYQEVPIRTITRMLARDAGIAEVHSLHLGQENPGYHAHGFLVAVNYPQLREEHFVRAFSGITEAEREFLMSHFRPLVPFLRRGLGTYVSEILRRALGGPTDTAPIGAPPVRVTQES